MKGEFTAIIEPAPEGGFWAICPEVPGANGQGETLEETKESLRQAIEMILRGRRGHAVAGGVLRIVGAAEHATQTAKDKTRP